MFPISYFHASNGRPENKYFENSLDYLLIAHDENF